MNNRRKTIAIIGDANSNQEISNLAFECGKLLIDNGFRLVNGAMYGVMEYSAKGARSSSLYKEGDILGIIPTYNPNDCNQYIDIPIATGIGVARNAILMSMCDAVIAIGGGSGSLSEIAFAWQMKKLIVCVGESGWHSKLQSLKLDHRRMDSILVANTPSEAIQFINVNIEKYQEFYEGVSTKNISIDEAEKVIQLTFKLETLTLLGKGQEGIVFTDFKKVYKLFYKQKSNQNLYWHLLSLSTQIQHSKPDNFFPFEVSYLNDNLILKYDYFESKPYAGGENEKVINYLKCLKQLGWVMTNFKADNFRITKKENFVCIDLGSSFVPYSEELFQKICMRAYLTIILPNHPRIKEFYSYTNTNDDFKILDEIELDSSNVLLSYQYFYNKIVVQNKKEILNPSLLKLFSRLPMIKTVLDYGSGYGDIANLLKQNDYEVTCFEPFEEIYLKYKDRYYNDIVSVHNIDLLIEKKSTYDAALCSLVLCHPLAESIEKSNIMVGEILDDLILLASNYIIIVICNPLSNLIFDSPLQKKILPDNFDYLTSTSITKIIHSSGNSRFDVHRPLSYYESLFKEKHLKVIGVESTQAQTDKNIGDFLIYTLKK